ncbi:3-hydroxyacyl-CoA dehydrogenase NAD-binding domain-containing protein [Amycolatopsis sp.]|uniref:3-hydroxyacyl-CoA dehydrogenase NAD-binding domain-containing protein n=1 Tax=Amycolatopsis sp. TaxID=37632 RepID=UPI002BFAB258|nr:3-hydroxyacyl-CoA dehydrogenase NAD-binding domain-containing protein [Amycolatopsis sp.]HVV07635.1 3-hydroxyacyl-CoA dehydrogenase NAD-binding domain-containing protein [Amycolatopsis sp.]
MRIRMIGTGVMGRGIAQWAATAGHSVELSDARPESVGEAVEFIRSMLDRAVGKGRTSAEDAAAIANRLVPLASPGEPGDDVDLVIEAVREDLGTKAELFAELERVLPASAVFATNTSSLPITQIAATLKDPSRLVGLHFFNPAPLMKIVEVIPGTFTRPEIVRQVSEFVRASGHEAVVVSDTPGFLINHAGRGLVTEALALLEEQVAEPAVIDRIARDVLGLKMGPFELMDLTGLDVTSVVIESIWEGFRFADRLRASYLTPNRVAAGLHGRKTGRGWYDYQGENPAEGTISGDATRPVWSPDASVREALAAAGATVSEGGIVLVPTWGTTVASAIAGQGLPKDRSFGVDPLSLATDRRVLAVTPASDVVAARDAAAVLSLGGNKVSVVRDTAGGVAQRLVASIVGVAAAIAEHGIASPGDIDLGVTRGLGYPVGPLAWGDRIGAERVLALQSALHETLGDPRYRPTRWVTERAQLGLPLTAAGVSPTDV